MSTLGLEPFFVIYTPGSRNCGRTWKSHFFRYFRVFSMNFMNFYSFWCSIFGIRRAACRNLRVIFKLDIFDVLTLNFTIFDRFFIIFRWNLRMFHFFTFVFPPFVERRVENEAPASRNFGRTCKLRFCVMYIERSTENDVCKKYFNEKM